ncbi:stalk domain-containing protein [Paenibacillus solani]|uniref:stalk domain-containing protein n=1 Tax=Paenibacillus solani TaxID=1705565 RepID=UPI003D297109
MKKAVIGFICGAVFFSGVSYAASGKLTATKASYKVYVNGKEQNLKNKPVVIDGITYLPVREVSNALGYNLTLNKGNIMLDNRITASGSSKTTSTGEFIRLDENIELKLKVDKNYYPLVTGAALFVQGDTIYHNFEAS